MLDTYKQRIAVLYAENNYFSDLLSISLFSAQFLPKFYPCEVELIIIAINTSKTTSDTSSLNLITSLMGTAEVINDIIITNEQYS